MPTIEYNSELTKIIREQLKLSQEKLSHLLEVALYTVQRWEYGTSQPRANHLGMIYDLAAENGIRKLPMYKKDGIEMMIKIT